MTKPSENQPTPDHSTSDRVAFIDIRMAIGDPEGKLMRSEVVERVRELVAENKSLKHVRKLDSKIIHNNVISMQAALIDAEHKGAEIGMQWIENTLCGPDLLPDESDPYYHDANAYRNYHDYDAVIKRGES